MLGVPKEFHRNSIKKCHVTLIGVCKELVAEELPQNQNWPKIMAKIFVRSFHEANAWTVLHWKSCPKSTALFSFGLVGELMALLQNYHLSSLVSRWEKYFGRDQGFFLPGKEEISSFQDRVRKKAAIFVVVLSPSEMEVEIKRKQQLCRNYLNRILIFKNKWRSTSCTFIANERYL